MGDETPTSRRWEVSLRVATSLLALAFVCVGVAKLAGARFEVDAFAQWGYAPWFRLLIGVVEVVAGAALLALPTAATPCVVLVGVMLGAEYTEVVHGVPMRAVFPAAFLVVLVALLRNRRRSSS